MNRRFVLLAWMPFLLACSDEAVDQDAVIHDPTSKKFVGYLDNHTYMMADGTKYAGRIEGDYIIWEQVEE